MSVEVQVASEDCIASPPTIKAWARGALGEDGRDVCIRVVGEAEAAELNIRYRAGTGATNVLAFPAEPPDLLGDIAVCAPLAAREARAQGKRLADHLAHLVVHGVLHLMGFDHGTDAEAAAMETREIAVLARCGVRNPYLEQEAAA